jgi:hypothetical protein
MKTPIQELIEELKANDVAHGMFWIKRPSDFFEKYLEKEKETIKESWWDGFKLQRVVVDSNADETYFNQKYNNNEGTTLG